MITLKDYLTFLYTEVTEARINLDKYVAKIAEEHSKIDILKEFPVPRFRIPEMELNIPVLIAGAKYKTTIKFAMEENEFASFVSGSLSQSIQSLKINMNKPTPGTTPPIGIIKPPIKFDILKVHSVIKPRGGSSKNAKAVADTVLDFYKKLVENPIQAMPENIVKVYCENLFHEALKENNVDQSTIKPEHKFDEIMNNFENKILAEVKENTIVVNNVLQNLLVNPETQLVKLNSNEFSVFQIKAKVNEEGLFIRTVADGDGEKKIVEFE